MDWAHLDGRSDQVRHEEHLSLPACRWLHEWLDGHVDRGAGLDAKQSLLTMAREEERRLTAADCEPVLRLCGFYEWRQRQRPPASHQVTAHRGQ